MVADIRSSPRSRADTEAERLTLVAMPAQPDRSQGKEVYAPSSVTREFGKRLLIDLEDRVAIARVRKLQEGSRRGREGFWMWFGLDWHRARQDISSRSRLRVFWSLLCEGEGELLSLKPQQRALKHSAARTDHLDRSPPDDPLFGINTTQIGAGSGTYSLFPLSTSFVSSLYPFPLSFPLSSAYILTRIARSGLLRGSFSAAGVLENPGGCVGWARDLDLTKPGSGYYPVRTEALASFRDHHPIQRSIEVRFAHDRSLFLFSLTRGGLVCLLTPSRVVFVYRSCEDLAPLSARLCQPARLRHLARIQTTFSSDSDHQLCSDSDHILLGFRPLATLGLRPHTSPILCSASFGGLAGIACLFDLDQEASLDCFTTSSIQTESGSIPSSTASPLPCQLDAWRTNGETTSTHSDTTHSFAVRRRCGSCLSWRLKIIFLRQATTVAWSFFCC